MKPQVSRRIPVLKLPVKAGTSDVPEDVDIPVVCNTETGTRDTIVNVRADPNDSEQSDSLVAENICKNTSMMTTGEPHADDHKDIVKKLKLQKRTGHFHNIAKLGVERVVSNNSEQSDSLVAENVCKNTSMMTTGERYADHHKDVIKKLRLQKIAKLGVQGVVPDSDEQSDSLVAENICKNTALMTTGEPHADDHKDIVKKLKMQKHTGHLQNIAKLGVERVVSDNSEQSGSLVAENVCKNASMITTGEPHADDHKDIVKKLRLQKHTGHLQNVAKLGVQRVIPDNAEQGDSLVAENVCKNAGMITTGERYADDHKDIVKKLRLQKHTGHLQNIAKLGVGDKTAKVTYVGSGLMSLPSPVLSGASSVLPDVSGTPMLAHVSGPPILSYALYTPFIDNGQSHRGSQPSGMLSPQRTVSHLPAASCDVLQTLSADDVDVCSVDSSVIDTEVVETFTAQSSSSLVRKTCHTSLKKPKHTISPGRCLLKY